VKKKMLVLLTPQWVLASATVVLSAKPFRSRKNIKMSASVESNGGYAKLLKLVLEDGQITKTVQDLLIARQKTWQLTKEEAEEIEELVNAILFP
jgi:hypothetical protein